MYLKYKNTEAAWKEDTKRQNRPSTHGTIQGEEEYFIAKGSSRHQEDRIINVHLIKFYLFLFFSLDVHAKFYTPTQNFKIYNTKIHRVKTSNTQGKNRQCSTHK